MIVKKAIEIVEISFYITRIQSAKCLLLFLKSQWHFSMHYSTYNKKNKHESRYFLNLKEKILTSWSIYSQLLLIACHDVIDHISIFIFEKQRSFLKRRPAFKICLWCSVLLIFDL